jgi:hypothetical protein
MFTNVVAVGAPAYTFTEYNHVLGLNLKWRRKNVEEYLIS